ncbi:uncharacterized oxidoreductase TM_0325-like [Patiria miniata]|uniref:Ketoreductase domain-containing protein n=1 Tax=Patiria miniata TaxID=46514 RepID=A0A914A1Q0_PATMI|nr:uncharacterized oxidoreductase TM_0325-like [Patiria miniata]
MSLCGHDKRFFYHYGSPLNVNTFVGINKRGNFYTIMGSFSRKVALITGASSGIGAETAKQLASQSCQVALTGRSEEKLQKVKEDCVKQGLAEDLVLLLPGNLTEDSFLEKVVNETVEHFGCLNILINCAGQPFLGSLESSTMDGFDETFRLNLRAPFVLTQLALPHLTQSKGVIVNVSSCASITAHPSSLVYAMSKAGIDGLTYTTSEEYAEQGVRVNAVNPGATMTPLFERNGAEIDKVIELSQKRHPLGRPGEASEVAKAIVFLASDSAAMVTGCCLAVDGGRSVLPGAPLTPIQEDSRVKYPV